MKLVKTMDCDKACDTTCSNENMSQNSLYRDFVKNSDLYGNYTGVERPPLMYKYIYISDYETIKHYKTKLYDGYIIVNLVTPQFAS